ncbi:carbonic anhydrase 1-like [Leguminivora glycinivorella]|uniref:carbonic anhydrase 1-like n=1 Tax=Leguminivora glycinivorella TaxID=1035111 RepID=UPI00200C8E2D|nr:carbonic anhydrase 1-like [Leguminivora glycinivorella]
MPLQQQQTEPEEETKPVPIDTKKHEPPFGTIDWLYYWAQFEGQMPTPIDVSLTGAMTYLCPELKWYNFNVYAHKIKLTNTGFTILLGAKWLTERPYLEGGCFRDKHVISQVHFHWGANMMEGSDHTVDKRRYPAEMQVTYFRAQYMTQQEALKYEDGVVVVCYVIKYGVNPDVRLQRVIDGFPRCRAARTTTRIGPYPMSLLMPMFYEDYFLYWGRLETVRGEINTVRWLVPRVTMFASFEQMNEFRKLWNPWDEPNLGNFRPLQERGKFFVPDDDNPPEFLDRHIWSINPHWNLYNSTLPIPRVPERSISILSPEYRTKWWMLPPQNEYMITEMINEQEGGENKEATAA